MAASLYRHSFWVVTIVLHRPPGIGALDHGAAVRRFHGGHAVMKLFQSRLGRAGEEHRLLLVFPFMETVGRYQAAAFFKGPLEAGFGGHRFRAGIDHFDANGQIVGPMGHEAPMQLLQDVSPFMATHRLYQ